MPGPLTKDHALAIAQKLGAEPAAHASKSHDTMAIYHDDIYVTSFGIRRGSRRNQSHSHIPKDIGVTPHFARELAECSKSLEDWVAKAKECGLIT